VRRTAPRAAQDAAPLPLVSSAPQPPDSPDDPPVVVREKRPRPWGRRLAALTISTLLTFGLVEVGARVLGFQPLADVYSAPELFTQHDPELGWSLEPGAEGTYVGPRPFPIQFRAPVRINSAGLRDDELGPVPDGGRVLVLGDSIVAGFEVPAEQTYPSVVQGRLTEALGAPVDVVNAGVRGYGTDQALLLYRDRLRQLEADVVVLHLTANDPDDNVTLHRMRRPFGKPAFALADDGSLEPVGTPVPRYPRCSAVRLDDGFDVTRVDDGSARAACWLQANVAERSAAFSFVLSRLQGDPGLLGDLAGLGNAAGEQQRVTAEGPTGAAPPNTAPDAAPPTGDQRVPEAPVPDLPRDAPAHRLTSALVREIGEQVRADGAQFVVVAESTDLGGLDLESFAADGIPVLRTETVLGPDQSVMRFANDGHLNQRGHARVADLLTPALMERLR